MKIPYTFIGGTKAKASEINANFQEVKKSVDANELNISNLTLSVENKANINGNGNTLFEVAESNLPTSATNLQQVQTLISPVSSIINGLIFTTSGTTIFISSGTCYDSTLTSLINIGQSTVDASSYPSSTTYYIYVANDTSSTAGPYMTVSTSNVSPTLPNNSIIYRKIGSFIKSSDTQFQSVSMIGTRNNMEEVINVELQ